jgi:NAD(P)-dependent dehydrogenase (short-subunit alcohol dehydrogenase family)
VLAIPCNLTDPDAVAAVARRVERELGPIDRWLNTAMTDLRYVCATRAALDCMRPRDRGSIVQVSAPRSVRLYPFRRIGAAAMAAATVVGALLLKRLVR